MNGEPSCNDINNCRTTTDIVWSCLLTMFACTWVAIHPNIPGPDEGMMYPLARRFALMLAMILVPELVILWAMRQWFCAYKVSKEWKEEGITMAHGFFISMGGFIIADDQGTHFVTPDMFKAPVLSYDYRIRVTAEDVAKISKAEIMDRSKSDVIAKGLAVAQVVWFIGQLVARMAQRLPAAKLEIVTLSFAVLNLVTYIVWWHKPYDVGRSIFISTTASQSRSEISPTVVAYDGHRIDTLSRILLGDNEIASYPLPASVARVPSCWSGGSVSLGIREHITLISAATVAVGIVFGSIHFIAWSTPFPSRAEHLLWQISSAAMIACPILLSTTGLCLVLIQRAKYRRALRRRRLLEINSKRQFHFQQSKEIVFDIWSYTARLALVVIPIAYLAARMILLIEAFSTLRHVSVETLRVVTWTDFIPHISV
ncbi:hypothetical protein C8J56DRAFT_383337 [Mycena floridula]|nr:hypothetical protein C8J56DRAFT_383337 [Mycena floridula]